jgi:hypothetical protein
MSYCCGGDYREAKEWDEIEVKGFGRVVRPLRGGDSSKRFNRGYLDVLPVTWGSHASHFTQQWVLQLEMHIWPFIHQNSISVITPDAMR